MYSFLSIEAPLYHSCISYASISQVKHEYCSSVEKFEQKRNFSRCQTTLLCKLFSEAIRILNCSGLNFQRRVAKSIGIWRSRAMDSKYSWNHNMFHLGYMDIHTHTFCHFSLSLPQQMFKKKKNELYKLVQINSL